MSDVNRPKSLADRVDKARPVVVFAPTPDDEKLRRQRAAWQGPLVDAGFKDRDVEVIEVVGESASAGGSPIAEGEARAIRDFCGAEANSFGVVLIGRDGTVKGRWADPVPAQEVFGKVDAMPMRQAEVAEKHGPDRT